MKTGRKRGRPRKPADTISPSQFGRVAKILSVYDHVRAHGQKQSAAVREVVDQIRQLNPAIPISDGTVKRVLAGWRPKGAEHVVLFDERRDLREEELMHRVWVRERIAEIRTQNGMNLDNLPGPESPRRVFSIRFGPRPDYPRHNRKRDTKQNFER